MNITNITLPLGKKKKEAVFFFLSSPSLQDLVFEGVIFTAS